MSKGKPLLISTGHLMYITPAVNYMLAGRSFIIIIQLLCQNIHKVYW